MTKEEIKLCLAQAIKESRFWEDEASAAEAEMKAAEDMCREWYDKVDGLRAQMKDIE